MNPIRPPGGPPAPVALDGAAPSAPSTVAPLGPAHAAGGAAPASPTHAVIADLQAARIGPDEAVRRLTDLAISNARCPPSLRPAVEARVRGTLARDPLVGQLLRRMGATAPEE
jgi:hypothetical protein